MVATASIEHVHELLQEAVSKHASDIHFEPFAEYLRIRLRIDGVLYETAKLNSKLAASICVCLKIMSKLDIAEKRLPQDGRFTLKLPKNETRDCRLNTCPTMFGEKIVIRILDASHETLALEKLGLENEQQNILLKQIAQPHGLILVTGPTGSGKTLTLYTILKLLNSTAKNISTVEDPIEINIPGINQIEVNHKIGLNFATTLRALLRQDPDIIMLGEIRDLETAEIAIKAAQTGHLVLSTLHTNTAIETLNRLQNMGIQPFNLASSINLIIAQRLVRKLCPYCKKQLVLPKITLDELGLKIDAPENHKFFTVTGCNQCQLGFAGRTGVFEILPISQEIASMIMEHKNTLEIAVATKLRGLRAIAIDKALQGITSLEEVDRVVAKTT